MPENLTGLIERVTFHNPESGFAVLRVKIKGREEPGDRGGQHDFGDGGRACRGHWSMGHRPAARAAVQSRRNKDDPSGLRGGHRKVSRLRGDPQHRSEISGPHRRGPSRANAGNLRQVPRFLAARQRNRAGTAQANPPKLGGAERSPQAHALFDRAWDYFGPSDPYLPHLRTRSDRQDQGEPVSTGRRHPGNRFQDGR